MSQSSGTMRFIYKFCRCCSTVSNSSLRTCPRTGDHSHEHATAALLASPSAQPPMGPGLVRTPPGPPEPAFPLPSPPAPGSGTGFSAPADAAADLAGFLARYGLRVYTADCQMLAVISVTAGLTVWTNGRVLWWHHAGCTTAWPAADPGGAAARLAQAAQSLRDEDQALGRDQPVEGDLADRAGRQVDRAQGVGRVAGGRADGRGAVGVTRGHRGVSS